jgi:hypothetical protein
VTVIASVGESVLGVIVAAVVVAMPPVDACTSTVAGAEVEV